MYAYTILLNVRISLKKQKVYNCSLQAEIRISKKRKMGCLISHTIYKVQKNPEDSFYFPLLLFKPWCSLDTLKSTYGTSIEASDACRIGCILTLQHHEKLEEIHTVRNEIRKLVNDLVQNYTNNANKGKHKKSKISKF